MSSLDDLERRITAVEDRLGSLAGLRARRAHELSDLARTLRAQQHTIQALAITQSQHTGKLDRQGEKLERHEGSLTAAHGKLDQIITVLDGLLGRGRRGRPAGAAPGAGPPCRPATG